MWELSNPCQHGLSGRKTMMMMMTEGHYCRSLPIMLLALSPPRLASSIWSSARFPLSFPHRHLPPSVAPHVCGTRGKVINSFLHSVNHDTATLAALGARVWGGRQVSQRINQWQAVHKATRGGTRLHQRHKFNPQV
jgi:hypothetical protein